MDTTHWQLNVEHDPETGDAVLLLPPDLLEAAGWKPGDQLEWIDLGNETWTLKKL
jgi:hypothetical protein